MFEKRPKLSFFILGMFFGALCGGILVYYNSVITNENKISVNLIPQIVKQVIGVINTKTKEANDSLAISLNDNQNLSVNNAMNTQTDDQTNETSDEDDLISDADSSVVDSLESNSQNELITLKKEELLDTKELIIVPLENNNYMKQNKSDSLLAVVSGTKDESKKGNQQKIMVELWKSPINYKGYQASKNKIIFYGLSAIDDLKLFSYKNYLLLKHNEIVYYIEYGNEFSNYEKVVDSSLLSQINKINP